MAAASCLTRASMSGGPHDFQRPRARVFVHRGEEEEGDPSEVIAMEVGNQEGIDLVALNPQVREARIRRHPAVHQQGAVARSEQCGGLSPAARPEGVTGSR